MRHWNAPDEREVTGSLGPQHPPKLGEPRRAPWPVVWGAEVAPAEGTLGRMAEADLPRCCLTRLHTAREHNARQGTLGDVVAFECDCGYQWKLVGTRDEANLAHANAMAGWMDNDREAPVLGRWEALGTGRAAKTDELPVCCWRRATGSRSGAREIECADCGTAWVWQDAKRSDRVDLDEFSVEIGGWGEADALRRQSRAVAAVLAERRRQDRKWGEQNHDDLRWLGIFVEEGLEAVSKAVNDASGDGVDPADLDEEIDHAAAVLLAWREARMRRREKAAGGSA